jgi:hypothetical protein
MGGEPLTDLGKIQFQRLVEQLKKGEKTSFSEHIGVLSGLKIHSSGVDLLESLKEKGALFLENHTENGPLKNGDWKLFATNHIVKQITGKEIRWAFGKDRTTFSEFLRKYIVENMDAIPVKDGDGTEGIRLIMKAFQNQDSVGLFPEGNGGKELRQGNPKAGGIILLAAKKNIPVVSTAAWFDREKRSCHLSFTLLNNNFITGLTTPSMDKSTAKQQIADYAMAMIAQNLPVKLRGHYQGS